MFIQDKLAEHEQLRLMFHAVESTRNGIVITDPTQPDNPIIYTNPAFTDITGYGADEILGRNCRFLQSNEHEQKAVIDIRKAIKEERSITAVLRNYKKDGTLFYNELTISPVHEEGGKLVAFVGVQNDITARIEAENRISDFYSVVSHELRTPIAKIKSSLAIILDGEAGPISDSVLRFVQISTRSADSLWRMIENILDFKKLESGAFRLLCLRLPLAQLVEAAVKEFEPVAHASGVTLRCELNGDPTVEADGQRIVQVLENLLSNAVKFSPPGSEILVRSTMVEPKHVRVAVQDVGTGIPEEQMTKLFQKFQQVEAPDRRSRGGTGLGLAICKAIIEAHGGSIGAKSEPGKGSNFWFELPAL
jgi:PAS domain S-box-containing protein